MNRSLKNTAAVLLATMLTATAIFAGVQASTSIGSIGASSAAVSTTAASSGATTASKTGRWATRSTSTTGPGGSRACTSWSIREASSTAGGMPAMYLLKSLLCVFGLVLFVQGLALIIRRGLFLAGRGDPDR